MTLKTEHTSFSQIEAFLQCEFKYMLKWKLGLKAPPNMNMVRGTAGHAALAFNSEHKMKTGEDLPTNEVTDHFRTTLAKESSGIESITEVLMAKTVDTTVPLLQYYMKRHAPLIKPLAAEIEFLTTIPTPEGTKPTKPIKGFIDAINIRTDPKSGRIVKELIDYKFPSSKPRGGDLKAEISDQVTIYDQALREKNIIVDEMGFLNFIPPTKTIPLRIEANIRPLNRMSIEERDTRIARVGYKIRTMEDRIEVGRFLPVDNPAICGGCEFKDICQYSLDKSDYNRDDLSPRKLLGGT